MPYLISEVNTLFNWEAVETRRLWSQSARLEAQLHVLSKLCGLSVPDPHLGTIIAPTSQVKCI